jgi:hypothetical protein
MILSPCKVTLETHESEQLRGVGRNEEHNGVDDDEYNEDLSIASERVVVSITHSGHGGHNEVEGGMKLVWVISILHVEVFDHHYHHC